MKKFLASIVLLILFASCSDQIRFNNPAIQGQKDNLFWRATSSRATLQSDNSLKIEGFMQFETLTLITASVNVGTYPLGVNDAVKASFETTKPGEEKVYSTGTNSGDGQIEITEFDPTNNTISGNFRFNAEKRFENLPDKEMLNFKQGVFYKIPIYKGL